MMNTFKASPNWSAQSWVPSLDPLRGFAALAVVVHHAAQAWGVANDGASIAATTFAWLGAWGVTLFFVLSGFCIHLPQARAFSLNGSHTIDWGRFARRRARRLLPTHYAALILSAAAGSLVQTDIIKAPTVAGFLAHAFMVHVWYPPLFYSINGVFWSIAIEVHFYICYPVYLWLRGRLGTVGTTVFLALTGLLTYGTASMLLQGGPRWVLQHLFLVSWWQWALGAGLADMYVRGKAARWTGFLSVRFAPAAYLILSIAVGLKDPTIHGLHVRFWVLPVLCGALLGSLVIRRCPHVPFLSNAGIYSYSVYLIHPVAFAALFAVCGYRELPPIIGIPTTIVMATFVSWLFFMLVERHFLSVRQRTAEPLVVFTAQTDLLSRISYEQLKKAAQGFLGIRREDSVG
ncbi:MAG: acyltransferase [Terriglobia bacterium]|jgi:peptidoglycan/LPS O-acetylase OafA/YrhL